MPFTVPVQFDINTDLHGLYRADIASPVTSLASQPSPMSPSINVPIDHQMPGNSGIINGDNGSTSSAAYKRRYMSPDAESDLENDQDHEHEHEADVSTSPSGETSTQPGNRRLRKRAKTKDEKEQRRIERIMRNRQAAHASREKKRRHMEELERNCESLTTRNRDLEYKLYVAQRSSVQAEEHQLALQQRVEAMEAAIQLARASGDISLLDGATFRQIQPSQELTVSPQHMLSSPVLAPEVQVQHQLNDFGANAVAEIEATTNQFKLASACNIAPPLFHSSLDSPSSIDGSDPEDSFDFKFESLTTGLLHEEPLLKAQNSNAELISMFSLF